MSLSLSLPLLFSLALSLVLSGCFVLVCVALSLSRSFSLVRLALSLSLSLFLNLWLLFKHSIKACIRRAAGSAGALLVGRLCVEGPALLRRAGGRVQPRHTLEGEVGRGGLKEASIPKKHPGEGGKGKKPHKRNKSKKNTGGKAAKEAKLKEMEQKPLTVNQKGSKMQEPPEGKEREKFRAG